VEVRLYLLVKPLKVDDVDVLAALFQKIILMMEKV